MIYHLSKLKKPRIPYKKFNQNSTRVLILPSLRPLSNSPQTILPTKTLLDKLKTSLSVLNQALKNQLNTKITKKKKINKHLKTKLPLKKLKLFSTKPKFHKRLLILNQPILELLMLKTSSWLEDKTELNSKLILNTKTKVMKMTLKSTMTSLLNSKEKEKSQNKHYKSLMEETISLDTLVIESPMLDHSELLIHHMELESALTDYTNLKYD